MDVPDASSQCTQSDTLSDLRDLGAGVRGGQDKGSKSARLQVRKRVDVPKEIPQILYLHQNKKRGENESSQWKVRQTDPGLINKTT